MKKLMIIITILFLSILTLYAGQMNIHFQDGSIESFVLSDIDNITFGQTQILFSDDFTNTNLNDNWIPFGNPLPFVETNAGNPAPCFDNNGDASYNSGALSLQTFDYTNGLIIESDMYVTSNPDGCWIGASIGLAKTMDYGSTTWPYYSVEISYSYSGSECWMDPNKEGCMTMKILKPDGEYETFDEEYYNAYLDSWHHYKIVIQSDHHVKFYIDDILIFEPTSTISLDYVNMPLLLGHRSSSYGEAYHDNIVISND